MFLEHLSKIGNRIQGAVALSLIGEDGIPVESINSNPNLDLEVLAAELIAQVKTMHASYSELAAGGFRQCSITTDRMTLVVSSLGQGYYLLLVLDREASIGQARFELRRARLLLEPELS